MAKKVKFDCTPAEQALVDKIVDRAIANGWVRGKMAPQHWYEALSCRMDLLATHANGCPIDFARILAADDFNFLHDIAGIARNIDRKTGTLRNCFLPRFTKREMAAAS